MKIAILKYNSGNTQSVKFALNRAGIDPVITDNSEELRSADKIIIPGVGEANSAMAYLRSKNLAQLILQLKQPVLGICLGMQLMCKYSEEGETKCLGIFSSAVKKFPSFFEKGPEDTENTNESDKIPQIGWNNIYDLKSPLFKTIRENEFQYFVHGYYVGKNEYTIATTNYITEYSSAIQKNNFYGVQFHPEKSGKAGEQILNNFLDL